jgi:hypothetical protein
MKKTLLLSLVLILGIASGAMAGIITMTFDEAFVTGGTAADRQDGTQVSTQYEGITWADIYPGTNYPAYTGQVVCLDTEFKGPSWNTGNSLWIYGDLSSNPQTAIITLGTPSNYFSMDYRRPQASGTIEFDLYLWNKDKYEKVYDGSELIWTPGDGWTTFIAPTVTFDKVVININDKFNVDNFSINPVPIPPSLILLISGLGGFGMMRKRLIKR